MVGGWHRELALAAPTAAKKAGVAHSSASPPTVHLVGQVVKQDHLGRMMRALLDRKRAIAHAETAILNYAEVTPSHLAGM